MRCHVISMPRHLQLSCLTASLLIHTSRGCHIARVQVHIVPCKEPCNVGAGLQVNGRDAQMYERAGLLTQRTVMAHGVTLTDAELALLAQRGTAIAHCPLSNFYFADVPLDVQRCLDAHVMVQP